MHMLRQRPCDWPGASKRRGSPAPNGPCQSEVRKHRVHGMHDRRLSETGEFSRGNFGRKEKKSTFPFPPAPPCCIRSVRWCAALGCAPVAFSSTPQRSRDARCHPRDSPRATLPPPPPPPMRGHLLSWSCPPVGGPPRGPFPGPATPLRGPSPGGTSVDQRRCTLVQGRS